MARAAKAARVEHVCGRCGYRTARWLGRCPECGEWASIVEEIPGSASGVDAIGIDRVPLEAGARLRTGIGELDRALGGGLVAGAAVLLAGDPGIGKSTLLLSALDRLARAVPGRPVLYVSGEESLAQIRLRGERLAALSPGLLLRADTSVADTLQAADRLRPQVLAIDSVQTLRAPHLDAVPGSVSQVREVASRLVEWAKRSGTPRHRRRRRPGRLAHRGAGEEGGRGALRPGHLRERGGRSVPGRARRRSRGGGGRPLQLPRRSARRPHAGPGRGRAGRRSTGGEPGGAAARGSRPAGLPALRPSGEQCPEAPGSAARAAAGRDSGGSHGGTHVLTPPHPFPR